LSWGPSMPCWLPHCTRGCSTLLWSPGPGCSWNTLPLGLWLCWGHLWLLLTLVSPSVFFIFFLFSPSPPCLLASLFFPCLPFSLLFLITPFSPCRFLGGPGEDLERNDGSQERPYFMSPELRDILLKGSAEEGKREEVEE
jgi:hypothetical protein